MRRMMSMILFSVTYAQMQQLAACILSQNVAFKIESKVHCCKVTIFHKFRRHLCACSGTVTGSFPSSPAPLFSHSFHEKGWPSTTQLL